MFYKIYDWMIYITSLSFTFILRIMSKAFIKFILSIYKTDYINNIRITLYRSEIYETISTKL